MNRFIQRAALAALLSLSIAQAYADVIKTVAAGATDQSVTLRIIDLTDGTPETGVVFNTSGIDLEYWRHGANAAVDITEATQTVNGAHTDGGFVHVGHGVYRLDLPDAAVASGVTAVEVYGTVTGMIVIGGTVQLSTEAADVAAVKADTAAILVDTGTSGVLVSSGTGSGQISITSGVVASDPATGTIDAAAIANGAIDAATFAADVDAEILSYVVDDATRIDASALNTASVTSIPAILVDTGTTLDDLVDDLESRLGTPTDFGSGTSSIAANLQDLADNGTATFDRSTDSLQAIRDRGDAAWTTGGAGSDPSIQSTTVASVTSQTILVPTATPTFVDQVNGWAVYLEDAGDADAYHLTTVTNYDQSNGEVTIAEAAPFTVAASDTMVFLPAFMDLGVDVTAISGDTTAASNLEAALDGTGGVTITAGLTGNVTGNLSGSVGSVTGAVGSVTGAVGSVTGNVGGNVTGSVGTVNALAANVITDASIAADAEARMQTEAADALTAYDPPTNAEMVARTLATADYATAAALTTLDTVADAIKAKTDSLNFTVAGEVDANTKSMNDVEVLGSGTDADPWNGE